eukprot:PhF_6_TR10639/c0_g1_i1/m.17230
MSEYSKFISFTSVPSTEVNTISDLVSDTNERLDELNELTKQIESLRASNATENVEALTVACDHLEKLFLQIDSLCVTLDGIHDSVSGLEKFVSDVNHAQEAGKSSLDKAVSFFGRKRGNSTKAPLVVEDGLVAQGRQHATEALRLLSTVETVCTE